MDGAHGPVLIVEDDDGIRDVLEAVLQASGHATLTAANGAEALSVLRDQAVTPCLILLDIMMPVMNGIEFREKQLADDSLAATPVVVVSAIADRAVARHVRASAYLRKPVDFDELLRHVDAYCVR